MATRTRTLLSDEVLDRLSASFQPVASHSDDEVSDPEDDHGDSSSEVVDCSDQEPPVLPLSPCTTSAKKQKFTSNKGSRGVDAPARDLFAGTPKNKRPVRPKQLTRDKCSVQKTKCTIFDFTSNHSKPVDVLKDDTADGKDQDGNDQASILSVLKDISTTLNVLVHRVENTEKDIRSVKSKLAHTNSPSSSSDSVSSKKIRPDVPNIIRSETRKVYKTLQDEDDRFSGFNVGLGIPFDDSVNQRVVSKLIKEVQATNPSFQACQIRAAAKTYFRSLKQDESLERRGKSEKRKKIRRQRERILRKLQERQAAFKKIAYQDKDKEKWSKVLVYDFMSSEESCQDELEEENECIIVKSLPWRSPLVNKFLESLDDKMKKDKSSQSQRQTKKRVIAATSSERPKPAGHFQKWVFIDEEGTP